MAALTDDELVAAAQGGDRNAADQLLRRHYDRIHAVCRRITGASSDADDACQEALIKIVRNLPNFDGRAAFSTWAYRIATNASLDELRRRRRRPLQPVNDDEGTTIEIPDETTGGRVTAVDDRLALTAALGDLSEDFRTAVVLRDVADLDYAEIADTLDIPIGTAKSRVARGRSALAERLRPTIYDGGDGLPSAPTATAHVPDDLPGAETSPNSDETGNRSDPTERPSDIND